MPPVRATRRLAGCSMASVAMAWTSSHRRTAPGSIGADHAAERGEDQHHRGRPGIAGAAQRCGPLPAVVEVIVGVDDRHRGPGQGREPPRSRPFGEPGDSLEASHAAVPRSQGRGQGRQSGRDPAGPGRWSRRRRPPPGRSSPDRAGRRAATASPAASRSWPLPRAHAASATPMGSPASASPTTSTQAGATGSPTMTVMSTGSMSSS